MISEKFQKIGWVKVLGQVFTPSLIVILLWIPCVIFIFATIQDRKLAGLVAGLGFLAIPLYNIYIERKTVASRSTRLIRVLVSGVFFLLSAMPIFLFRIFNWEKSLEEINIFGLISGRDLHSLSNGLYMLMLIVYVMTNLIDFKKTRS